MSFPSLRAPGDLRREHIRLWFSGSREERRAFQRHQKGARGRRAEGKHRERIAEGTSFNYNFKTENLNLLRLT